MRPPFIPTTWEFYGTDDPEDLVLDFGDAEGNLVNMSDWENWRAQWRPQRGAPEKVAITIGLADIESGRVVLSLTGDEIAASPIFGCASGVFDIRAVHKVTGKRLTHAEGRSSWQAAVTDDE